MTSTPTPNFGSTAHGLDVFLGSAHECASGTGMDRHVLATIRYGTDRQCAPTDTEIDVALPLLDGPDCEFWTTTDAVQHRNENGMRIASTTDAAFVSLSLSGNGSDLEKSGHDTYIKLLNCLQSLGYPHLIRTWNYFPGINEVQEGEERYQQFCVGRHRAFSERYYDFLPLLPAATAIGSAQGEITIFVLASTSPGLHIENPRQTSAYRYPRQYGRVSPSFARATVKSWGDVIHLYVSGTASIVGHASQHVGDVEAQLLEISKNLDALADTCRSNGINVAPDASLKDMDNVKVYVRRPQDFAVVRHAVETSLKRTAPTLYLHGDICREELLVEIEGMWRIKAGR